MKKIFIPALGLFLFIFIPGIVFSQPPENPGPDIGLEKKESVVQQGQEIKLDQVEVVELDEDFIQNEKEEYERKPQLREQLENDITPGRGESQGRQGMEAIQTRASEVAQYVQELLNDPDVENTEIGQRVSQFAMEQNQAEEQIRQRVQSIESRGRIMRFFFGADRQAVQGLENELEQARQRLADLEEIGDQAPTEEIQAQVQGAEIALQEQIEALDQTIAAQRRVRGIFSFLSNIFGR